MSWFSKAFSIKNVIKNVAGATGVLAGVAAVVPGVGTLAAVGLGGVSALLNKVSKGASSVLAGVQTAVSGVGSAISSGSDKMKSTLAKMSIPSWVWWAAGLALFYLLFVRKHSPSHVERFLGIVATRPARSGKRRSQRRSRVDVKVVKLHRARKTHSTASSGTVHRHKGKLKKGSPEARAFMAKLRKMRKK